MKRLRKILVKFCAEKCNLQDSIVCSYVFKALGAQGKNRGLTDCPGAISGKTCSFVLLIAAFF